MKDLLGDMWPALLILVGMYYMYLGGMFLFKVLS